MIVKTSLTTRRGNRPSFTLVELLVAMALIIFIMTILTEAFSAGTGVFRTLKAQGDMTERLRNASNLLVDDLRQPHFDLNQKKLSNLHTSPANTPLAGYFYIQQLPSTLEGNDGNPIHCSFRMNPAGTPALCFTVRRNGIQPSDYFTARVYGQNANGALVPTGAPLPPFLPAELLMVGQGGTDALGNPLLGSAQGPADYQTGRPINRTLPPIPPPELTLSGTLISLWAEVGWFMTPELDATGQPVISSATNGLAPMPLFTLRRRVRVVVPDDPVAVTAAINSPAANGANRVPAVLWGPRYAEVSCLPDQLGGLPNTLYFNSPSDLLRPERQAMVQPFARSAQLPTGQPPSLVPIATNAQGDPSWFGDDIVLADVISFNVRILAADVSGNYPANGGVLPSNLGRATWLTTNPPDFLDVAAANAYYTPPVNGAYPPLPTLPTVNIPVPMEPIYNTGNYDFLRAWPSAPLVPPPSPPPPYLIKALEITIRVWDVKTSQVRQITIVQDM
jgi:type II secretory pathway pseudopilin PulG